MTKEIIKQVLGFLVFIFLIFMMFSNITYLFRNNNTCQRNVNGIKNEKNLDVVCIGGSSTYVYWEPFLAWSEFGLTSYDLATDSDRPALMKAYVKEAVDKANPDLLILDMRSYAPGTVDDESLKNAEPGIRNMTDSLDLGINRLIAINNVMQYYDGFHADNVDPWSFYFDIAKYHTNLSQLGVEDNWKHFNNNNYENPTKGFKFVTSVYHDFVSDPVGLKTTKIKELNSTVEDSLIDLLEYLKQNDINALFIAGPIPVTEDIQAQYNYISSIVSSYGYKFLNTNNYYDEMGIDFSKDFYNSEHVNVFGAEKYTRFVSDYIKKNYDITDHRSDSQYSAWNDYYEEAHKHDRALKEAIENQIKTKKASYEKRKDLQLTNDFDDWFKIAIDENFTVIIVSNSTFPAIYSPWNIKAGNTDIIRLYTANKIIAEYNEEQEEDFSAMIGTHELPIVINSGNKLKIWINEKDLPLNDEGTFFVVFDNNYNQILDCIRIIGNGNLNHVDF